MRDAPVTPFLKTSPDSSARTAARTSGRSSPRPSASRSRKLPMCLCLTGANGQWQGFSLVSIGASRGARMTRSGGEYHNDAGESACWLILMGIQPGSCFSGKNWTERPDAPIPSKLSDVLETNPDPKYNLSAKACLGILNRARRRGKKLPEVLEAALIRQSQTP